MTPLQKAQARLGAQRRALLRAARRNRRPEIRRAEWEEYAWLLRLYSGYGQDAYGMIRWFKRNVVALAC